MKLISEDTKTIPELIAECHGTAIRHGWETNGIAPFPEMIALMHSELSEALEEYRAGHGPNEIYYNGAKPEGIPIELADVLVRMFHYASALNINLEAALKIKMAYNESRPFRHGNKIC